MSEIIESDAAKPYGVIYKWTNKISGKAYIGQTTQDPEERKAEHLYPSSDSVISRAIRKYGVENFNFEVIDATATNQDELDAREKYWSEYYHTWIGDPECWGYNVRECGGSHGAWPQFECMQDAAEWAGVSIQALSNYFTQNRKTCGNYTWEKFSKEENN